MFVSSFSYMRRLSLQHFYGVSIREISTCGLSAGYPEKK
jgi:hypothetical protein